MPNEEPQLPVIRLISGKAQPHQLGGAAVSPLAAANAEVKRKMAASLSDRAAGKLSGVGLAQVNLAPAILRVNDKTKLDFEPGGQYEISGRGFGEQKGSVFLRFDHYNVTFRIDAWHDGKLYVGLADDISGLPDAVKPTLFVDVPGKDVLQTTHFGFRAARETVNVVPPESSFSYDKGKSSNVLGITVWECIAPDHVASDGQYLNVSRYSFYGDPHKSCFNPGFDVIDCDKFPLQPGFSIAQFVWYHGELTDTDAGSEQRTAIGSYSADWEGNRVRIRYAVQRDRTPQFVLVPGNVACSSSYKIRFDVSGPRGMPPL
ncbi:hypothetical protein Terro_3053 [Terriglobus roseus DSM 18391]|uniref:Uncharacterized protein n=2 Tax=Terriglobus roseus TaxID=392734 RepID=I3ZJ67_TERRK|nr:hypothetical protein Terro_3053 [Terriglobus roseus DSM 18391]